ncbi:1-acyl-sn-glycerol-3-phosphate acyltransferase [Periweissella cryptocerci]|uniref:1-acyl-sn-glycerol-3-phosphate acyltransferase n=1 Tax=Periweissella cryptocerci TaxID=2506420 RepID=A0A4V1AIF6_9LACO|nr:1-acyl-sn-glycerol-3-phosphate acyltransferase [Periweissella cryptocerci]QBO35335.1 1-acyl-sn-glycerol-3-phosphate acyltransferase [Periweissella cryptocerci]
MLYSFLRGFARALLYIINGKPQIRNYDKLPEGTYILAGPHRTWWDPIYFALAAAPLKFSFMAKIELFKNPILKWILVGANAFPVDRANPGPSVIKTPVKNLKSGDLGLIIFPSGSRHSNDIKSGAMMIAKLSGKPIVPIVYQGPLTFGGLFKRNNVELNFGDPIYIDRRDKLTEARVEEIGAQMQTAFDALDKELNPDFVYVDQHPEKAKIPEE